MENEVKEINKDNLQVGDVVYVPYNASVSPFNSFRYPIYNKEVIQKITPKRTKFGTDRQEHDRTKKFYEWNECLEYRNKVATCYRAIEKRIAYLYGFSFKILSDEQILEIYSHIDAIKDIITGTEKSKDKED